MKFIFVAVLLSSPCMRVIFVSGNLAFYLYRLLELSFFLYIRISPFSLFLSIGFQLHVLAQLKWKVPGKNFYFIFRSVTVVLARLFLFQFYPPLRL